MKLLPYIFFAFGLCTSIGIGYFWLENKPDSLSLINPVKQVTVISKVEASSSAIADKNKFVITVTGDIIPARISNIKMQAKGYDYPFENVKDLLVDSDLTIGNLESPLLTNCVATNIGMKFCGDKKFADSLKRNGVGVLTLENNHIGNYGLVGISETEQNLQASGLEYVREDQSLIKNVKGVRVGILALNGVGSKIDKEKFEKIIKEVRNKVDVLTVSVHWGAEYTYDPVYAPGIAPDDPKEIGHWLVDNGVDVVFGNHPHWVQGTEKYKNGWITYAHGNFIFDQEWSRETKEGVIGKYYFDGKKLVNVKFIPIVIEDYVQPRLADPNESEKILGKMKESSEKL